MICLFAFGEKCEFFVHTVNWANSEPFMYIFLHFSKLENMLVKTHSGFNNICIFNDFFFIFLFTFFANLLYTMQKLAS